LLFAFYFTLYTILRGNGAIKNEVGTRWVIFAALWSFTLAYLSAAACYQLAVFSSQPVDSFISIVVIMAVFFSIYYALKRAGKNILTIPTLVSYR
jgi:ferrous iron transport protein B